MLVCRKPVVFMLKTYPVTLLDSLISLRFSFFGLFLFVFVNYLRYPTQTIMLSAKKDNAVDLLFWTLCVLFLFSCFTFLYRTSSTRLNTGCVYRHSYLLPSSQERIQPFTIKCYFSWRVFVNCALSSWGCFFQTCFSVVLFLLE